MNVGNLNELNILKAVNQKKFKDLSSHWKQLIKRMFPFVEENDVIKAYFYKDRHAKPDITILCRNSRINVSIKSGHNPSMHQEYYYDFYSFLKRNNVSEKTIRIIYFYHFGMTKKLSNNGEPFTKEQIVEMFPNYIEFANKEINKNLKLLKEVVERTCLVGTTIDRGRVDFFYYGNDEKGFLLSPSEIYDLVLNEKKEDCSFIHFGGLIYQPAGRRVDRRERNYVRIKWPLLCRKFYED